MFKCMPFLCNRHVDYVNKSSCNLSSVPDEVLRYARTLEELLLDNNQIKDLPKGLYRLYQLRKLTLSNNMIEWISPDISLLVHLQELNISRNELEEIPEDLKYCTNLQVLDITGNPLQKLPESFTQLHRLVHVGLSEILLSRLPMDIGSLAKLETLELRENMLRYLPSSMSRLVKLRSLDLGDNLLEELPDGISHLVNLEELRLDSNSLSQLPPLGSLKKLTQLDLFENKFEKLPDDIGDLLSLTDLLVSKNQLETLPLSIGNLRKLVILKADQNRLLQLPNTVAHCICLQELILTENLLMDLPPAIGQLKSLTHLNVDRNRLQRLPVEIGDCTSLNVLSLRDNQLGQLPSSVGRLQQLHILDVSENRLHHLPVELGQCSLKAIWLSENQAQSMLKFQEDVDEQTGRTVLTCFLLPQQSYHTESMENLLKGSIATEADSQLSWSGGGGELVHPTVVRFATEEDDDLYDDDNAESYFVRHNTPHPKELRSRYSKLLRKSEGDDQVAAAEPHHDKPTAVSFLPSRDVKLSDSDDELLLPQPDVTDNDGEAVSNPAVEMEELEPVDRSPVENTTAAVPSVMFVSGFDDEDDNVVQHRAAEAGDDDDDDVAEDVPLVAASDDEDEDDGARTRRVGFSLSEDFTEKEGRLQRRDTPHHLKNKRISSSLGKSTESESEQVRRILAMVAAGNHQSASATSDDADERPSLKDGTEDPVRNGKTYNVDDVFHNEDNDEGGTSEQTRLLPSATASVAEPSMPRPLTHQHTASVVQNHTGTYKTDSEMYEEIVLRVERPSGDALGISIAGGDGSSPYRSNDHGVFVSRVAEDSHCYRAGLRVGDKLVSVNGQNMLGVSHQQAVKVLCDLQTSIILVVLRQRLDAAATHKAGVGDKDAAAASVLNSHGSLQTIVATLRRDVGGLGFSVAGGKGTMPYCVDSESVFISKVMEGGAAERDGKLRAGDQIVSVNGIDVTSARHDQVIRLLTSDGCQEFTIVAYRDPHHPLSPISSPRSHLFMPSQPVVNMTVDSSSYPESLVVAKRPSPGPQLHISTTAGTPANAAVSFVPRPTSAEVGKSAAAADAGKSPSSVVKTVTYSIGDSSSAGVEPPMPLMKMRQEKTFASARGPASPDGELVMKISQGVPCHDANLLFVTPPAPPRSSAGSGVNDLFDALEKTYHASQHGSSGHGRTSVDAGVRSSVTVGQASPADRKRHSLSSGERRSESGGLMSPPIGFTVSTEPASVSRQSSTLEPTSATHGAKLPADTAASSATHGHHGNRPPVAPKPWKVLSPISVNSPTSPIGQTSLPTSATVETNGTEGSMDSGSTDALLNPTSMDALLRQSRIPSARVRSSASAAETQKSPSGPEVEREVMAFNTKKKFFEQEIENAQQSRPSSDFQSTS